MKSHLSAIRFLQTVIGIDRRIKSRLYTFYSAFNNIYCFLHVALMLGELPYCDNIGSLALYMGHVLIHIVALFSLFYMHTKNLYKLYDNVENYEQMINKSGNQEIQNFFAKLVTKNNKYNNYLIYQTVLFSPVYVIGQWIHKSYLYPQRYPFDMAEYYWEINIFQLSFMILCGLPRFLYVRNCMISFVTYISSRLDVLIFNLTKLKALPYCLRYKSREEQEEYIYKIISMVAQEHTAILQEVKNIKKETNIYILLDFLCSSIEYGSILFSVLVPLKEDTSSTPLVALGHILVLCTPMVVIYGLGENMKTKSSQLGVELYNLNWYNLSYKNKRAICLILMRTQRELTLLIGPFFEMNLESLSKALKTAVSYCFFMKTLYNLSED